MIVDRFDDSYKLQYRLKNRNVYDELILAFPIEKIEGYISFCPLIRQFVSMLSAK